MDRLQAMQTFVRVVETGSFSAVAREQSSTQSAVSKQVAGLEKYLGVRLLARTTRAVTPTDGGLRYFEEARRLVGVIGEAETLLRQGERPVQARNLILADAMEQIIVGDGDRSPVLTDGRDKFGERGKPGAEQYAAHFCYWLAKLRRPWQRPSPTPKSTSFAFGFVTSKLS